MVNPIDPGKNYSPMYRPAHNELPCTHDTNCPRDAKNMPGHRHRTKTGQLWQKRDDTTLGALEKQYGEISSLDPKTTLKELREKTGDIGINKIRKKMKEIEG